MKRLGQGRGSALKAMVSLHFPFRCICGVRLPHSRKRQWWRREEEGGAREGERRRARFSLAIDWGRAVHCALSASYHTENHVFLHTLKGFDSRYVFEKRQRNMFKCAFWQQLFNMYLKKSAIFYEVFYLLPEDWWPISCVCTELECLA